ncbi:MAG: hypothetical protein RL701_7078 [Pseudomonadota bacterium]|jgi:hypothetical protein
MRAPFLHFVLLGALTFGLHRFLQNQTQNEQRLVVSAQTQRELAALFEQRQQRAPRENEREQLVQRWVEDEVLFREGLRVGLVQSDAELRAQIVSRMRALLQVSAPAQTPSVAELERFYDAHRADYIEPAFVEFRERLVPAGPSAADTARAELHALNTLPENADSASELHLTVSQQQGSEAQLSALYGPELAHKLFTLELGTWHELRSARGRHLVKLVTRSAAKEPGFAAMRARVVSDFHITTTRQTMDDELARLESRWRVDVQGSRE